MIIWLLRVTFGLPVDPNKKIMVCQFQQFQYLSELLLPDNVISEFIGNPSFPQNSAGPAGFRVPVDASRRIWWRRCVASGPWCLARTSRPAASPPQGNSRRTAWPKALVLRRTVGACIVYKRLHHQRSTLPGDEAAADFDRAGSHFPNRKGGK